MKREKIDWAKVPLGKKHDSAIAEDLGCSQAWVCMNRRTLGIAPFVGHEPRLTVDWDNAPLGEVPDQEIADDLGCSVSLVRLRRVERGIVPHSLKKYVKPEIAVLKEEPRVPIMTRGKLLRLWLELGGLRGGEHGAGVGLEAHPPLARGADDLEATSRGAEGLSVGVEDEDVARADPLDSDCPHTAPPPV